MDKLALTVQYQRVSRKTQDGINIHFWTISHLLFITEVFMDSNLKQYIATALWSSVDDQDQPMDKKYSISDLSEEALEKASTDWNLFVKQAGDLLNDLDLSDVAHDFWLTRNHHGAGLWDGDYKKELGEKLTKLANNFSQVDLYVGDDGKLYFS
jgi:hypothetical protein